MLVETRGDAGPANAPWEHHAGDDSHRVDFFATKHAVVRYLNDSSLAHAVLRSSALMKQHAHDFNGEGLFKCGRAQLVGAGTKPRNFVAADDVAQFAVLALTAAPMPSAVLEICARAISATTGGGALVVMRANERQPG